MAKKKDQPTALSQDLSDLLDEVNAEHGEAALMTMEGTSGLWPMSKRMPTGSLQLDLAIGIGGWARGRLHMIAGEESSGKTTLALMTAAAAQARSERVVYIDAESALNPDWMVKLGVDINSLLISQPSSLESSIDIAMTVLKSGKCDLLIMDSIPAMKSRIVMEGDAEQETRALEARRWSAQTQKIVIAAKESNATVIFINQIRDSMNMYVAESIPGGRTLKFAMSTTVKLKKFLEGRGQDEGIDYHDARFEIIKNKQGSPYKKGEFTLFTQRENPLDYVADVFYTAQATDIIVKDQKFDEDDGDFINKRGWFTLLLDTDEVLEAIRAHEDDEELDLPGWSVYREGAMLEWFRSVPGLAEAVEKRILSTLDRDAIIKSDSEAQTEVDVNMQKAESENEEEEDED